MKILSTKLSLKDDVTKEQVYATITKWLKDYKPTFAIGEQFEQCENKLEMRIAEKHCTIETLTGEKEGMTYFAFRLVHRFYSQEWDTEIILEETLGDKAVTIHIGCSGDTTLFKKVPVVRTDVIRSFINDGRIKDGKLPIQDKPISANYGLLEYFTKVMTNGYDQSLPMVYISKIFNRSGYEADTEKLARYLAGIAYIVAEEDGDFAYNLKERTGGVNPYNGHIAVYYPNGKIDRIKPSEFTVWGAADSHIMNDIVRAVTAQTDKSASSWEQYEAEKIAAEVKDKAALLDDYINGYDSLEDKLKAAKEKIAMLTEENTTLRNKNESLQAALTASGVEENIIIKSPVDEFFEGEQHDLLVTVLKEAAARCGGFDTRQNELINSLLENNDYIGNGRETNDVVKRVLSSGEAIGKREIAELERVGFKLVAEQNHYKIVYRGNERYWFTISKTPSDRRSGQNNASDIIKRLTVYQSDKK